MVEMFLTAAYRIKFYYTVYLWERPPCSAHTCPPVPYGCGYNKGARYSSRGPCSHRKWSSQIRLSAVQMMRSQREVKAHARWAQGRAERKIPTPPPPPPKKPGRIAHSHSCVHVRFFWIWNSSYHNQGHRLPFRRYREQFTEHLSDQSAIQSALFTRAAWS